MARSKSAEQIKDAEVPSARKDAEESRLWVAENAEAIRDWTEWAERNELPLANRRSF